MNIFLPARNLLLTRILRYARMHHRAAAAALALWRRGIGSTIDACSA